MAATFHDSADGADDNSGTVLSCDDTLAVTAGDIVVVGFKWEGANGATATIDTGDSTPVFSVGRAQEFHAVAADLSGGTWYWKATSTGTVTVRATLDAARTFRRMQVHSHTPQAGTTLVLGNTASAQQTGVSDASSGNANTVGAGLAVGFALLYGSRNIAPGTGWTEPTEFESLSLSVGSQYQFPTGAGTIASECSWTGGVENIISQLVIFDEQVIAISTYGPKRAQLASLV